MNLLKLEDGREFPHHDGRPLSWCICSTLADDLEGFPRLRAVVQAMNEYRPVQLERERRELIKDSFGQMFGHNARKILAVIEDEIRRNVR